MIFNKAKKRLDTQDNVEAKAEQVALYMLAEKVTQGIIGYTKDNGLPLQAVFTDVEEAKIAMLTETRHTRLIIVESGMGRFISTNIREDLIDLLGICDGDEKKVCIFYTNSSLKGDATKAIGKKGRDIMWYQYKSTVDTIDMVLNMQEKYIDTTAVDKEVNENEALGFKGYKTDSILEPLNMVFNLDEEVQCSGSDEFTPKFKVMI